MEQLADHTTEPFFKLSQHRRPAFSPLRRTISEPRIVVFSSPPWPKLRKVKTMSDLSSFTGKLQKTLCSEIYRSSASEVFFASADNRDVARLRSCRGSQAGRWVEAVPTSKALALKPNAFRLAAYLRLGCPLDFALACFDSCECNSVIDNQGYHLLTCKHGGGPVWAHNNIVSGWADCVRDAGLLCKVELRFRYFNNENRPDIVACRFEAGVSMELDISLAHPWSSEASRRSAVEDCAAAIIREEAKVEKYDANIRPSGAAARFYPLVFEHFGHWGKLADKFFKVFLTHVERTEGKSERNEFACYWRRRLSVLLQLIDGAQTPVQPPLSIYS
ncbi:uncharacterized protein [Oscarella lobularis]|uniref:uncharacterized protein n=1 Tax=Oscarella lobularis TaxID=121494 RepID=UPI003314085B